VRNVTMVDENGSIFDHTEWIVGSALGFATRDNTPSTEAVSVDHLHVRHVHEGWVTQDGENGNASGNNDGEAWDLTAWMR